MIGSGRSLWTHFQRGACVVAVSALAACASRMDSAPVVDRTGTAPGLATAGAPGVPPGPPPPGYYQVQPGDTLYRVALKSGQNFRDIATWNNLSNPNQIEVGQVLRVVPPGATPDSNGLTTTPLGGGGVAAMPPAGTSAYASPYANNAAAPAGASSYPSPYANGSGGPANNGLAQNTAPAAPSYGSASTPGVTALPAAPESSIAAATPPAAVGNTQFIWPVQGGSGANPILQRFDGVKSKGIDIGGAAGTPILAAAAGRVLYAGSELRGYGNLIIIKHDDHFLTAYGHNRVLLVKNNDAVTKGQKIAEMGDTQASRVELHFEVRKDSTPVDPMKYLPPQ